MTRVHKAACPVGSPDAAAAAQGEAGWVLAEKMHVWKACVACSCGQSFLPRFCPEFTDKYRVLWSLQELQALVYSRQCLEESHSPNLFWLEQGSQNTFIPMQTHFPWQNPTFGAGSGLVSAKLFQRFRNTDFSHPKWLPPSRNVSFFFFFKRFKKYKRDNSPWILSRHSS